MGRTKGTLICKGCRRANSESEERKKYGCKHCRRKFFKDVQINSSIRGGENVFE